MRKPEIAQHVQDKYRAFINAIPLERFSDRSLKVPMEAKYFHVKGMSVDGLLTKGKQCIEKCLCGGCRNQGCRHSVASDSERENSNGHAERVHLEEVERDAGDDLCSLKQR